MAGFNQDPLQIVNLIADNLRDRYQSDSVLKEIIQNSDDAGVDKQSIFLEFGIADGIAHATHPLLSGQALFFLNNGRFLPQDAQAIRSFGLNYKAAESTSIGKFGLGMKSVFHFCEAFFFLAHDNGQQYAEILNPWSSNNGEKSLHADWDHFDDADRKRLFDQMEPVFSSLPTIPKSWFLLWLPLRKQQHLQNNGQQTGSIIDDFPGDDHRLLAFLYERNLATELAGLLPLLRKTDHLRQWRLADGQAQTLFQIDGSQNNIRLLPAEKFLNGSHNIEGCFNCQYSNGVDQQIQVTYAGREQHQGDGQQFQPLQKSSLWPKTQIRNEHGYPEQVPDKTTPHSAVVFFRDSGGKTGKLILRWAVFLPLENHKEEYDCDIDGSITITLHGFFFIDAGRGTIEGLNSFGTYTADLHELKGQAELRQQWNKLLATEGVMPLFLPALADFVRKAKLNNREITSLCKSLRDTAFYRNFCHHLCLRQQLLRCLTPQGGRWKIIPAAKKILPLPSLPPTIPNRPWDVFPWLKSEQTDVVLVDKEAPYLRASSLPQWGITDLLNILEVDAAAVFSDKGRLPYFIKVLLNVLNESFQIRSNADVQKKLKDLLQTAFSLATNILHQQQQNVRYFSSLILPFNRYPLPLKNHEVLQSLQKCPVTTLLLSVEFDCLEKPGTAKLSPHDSMVILQHLSKILTDSSWSNADGIYDDCRKSIDKILDDLPEAERQKLLRENGRQLKILAGYDCHHACRTNFSTDELITCKNNNLLFRFGQGITEEQRLGLAKAYQQVIDGQIIVVNTETAKLIFGDEHHIPSCDANGCLQSLGTIPCMKGAMEDRNRLISRLAGEELSDSDKIRGMRYLIHGYWEHGTDESTILWVRGSEVAPAWEKMWCYIDRGTENQWTLLDQRIVFELPFRNWEKLGIKEIKPAHILAELNEHVICNIEGHQFSPSERRTILMGITHNDELWKSLPFHETVSGQLVAIKDDTLLATDITLPLELHDYVTLIKQAEDQDLLQQQQKWIAPLDDVQAISAFLRHPESYRFVDLIMDHLENMPTALDNEDFRNHLKELPWLYNDRQKPVKPQDVIYLPEIQGEVDSLLNASQGPYCSLRSFPEKIQKHPGCELLKRCNLFTGNQQGMKILAILASETARYHLGIKQTSADNAQVLAGICTELPEEVALPGWRLLHQGITAFGFPFCEQLLQETCKPIAGNRLVGILHWLQKEHETASDQRKQAVMKAFNTYLVALAENQQARKCLADLKLLNQEGQWCPASKLCANSEGVSHSHILDITHQGILKDTNLPLNNVESTVQSSPCPDISPDDPQYLIREQLASIQRLSDFFAAWEGLIAQELICTFIILLGDQPQMRNLAERFRGNHSIDWICETIPWELIPQHDGVVIIDLSKKETFNRYRFLIEIIAGDTIEVNSLLGEKIQVPLISTTDGSTSLIVGTPNEDILNKDGKFYVLLQIRQPDLTALSIDTLSQCLKQSAEMLLRKVYQRHHCNLDNVWEELNKSEQLGIHIAQRLVLEHAPFYLRQLGIHKHPILKTQLNRWNEVRHKISEFRDNRQKRAYYESELRDTIENIRDLLQNNPDVERDVLEAVKMKVRDYQYSHTSIPFELFQNADDAVVELEEIKNYPATNTNPGSSNLPDEAGRFQVIIQNKSITFLHWGRPINYIGSDGFPGREKGYHWDLEKMLILSSSEKNEHRYVTGKFGLGFKSVFLASDNPKIVSGTLAFEIIAGFYPQPIKHAIKHKLIRVIREKYDRPGLKTTHIHLPLHEGIETHQVLDSFSRLAGYLAIFAKKIRRVEMINRSAGQSGAQVLAWEPRKEKLECGATIEVGSFPQLNDHLVYVRQEDHGILLAVGPDGFQPLPENVPGVWVVAPTEEQKGLGFAVNGMFAIDPGRARLAGNDEQNAKVAQRIGRSLGHALVDLFTMTQQDWPRAKELFHLANDLSAYRFWASLWQVLASSRWSSSNNAVHTLLQNILTNQYGICYLIDKKDALPNGLWGDFQALTQPAKIRWILQGSLSTEKVFQTLLDWPFFRGLLESPSTVISSTIYKGLNVIVPSFAQTTGQWKTLRLADVFQYLSDGQHIISPEEARILGKVINHERLKEEGFAVEREKLSSILKTLMFEASNNTARRPNNLLVATKPKHTLANDDEPLRAAFAPERFILNHAYDKRSQDFFFSCREKIEVLVEYMTQWALQAEDSHQRTATLRYLLDGEHAHRIAKEIRDTNLMGCWLYELHPNSPYFEGWTDRERKELLFRVLPPLHDLERFMNIAEDVNDDEIPENLFSSDDPQKTLEKLYQWWQSVGREKLRLYEQQWYPNGRNPQLADDEAGNINRSDWLTLLMLGHCHTLGRQRPEQHRGFIETCQRRRWWNTFSAPHPENRPDEWMKILEDYIGSQIDNTPYEHWMNRFPAIYRFSRYLDDCAGIFLSLDQRENIKNLSIVLNSKADPSQQGGGYNAAPVARTLGIGACFVLRELKRQGLIQKDHVVPHCYVPVKRVREMCTQLGCQGLDDNAGTQASTVIHRFLCNHLGPEKATFEGAYDIPLQMCLEELRKNKDFSLYLLN